MQINKINFNNNTKQTKQYATKGIGFKGKLTRLLQSKPSIPLDLIEQCNKTNPRDKGIVGIFPPEFIKAIKTNLGNDFSKEKMKECIEGSREAFAAASKNFENIENINLGKRRKDLSNFTFLNIYKEASYAIKSIFDKKQPPKDNDGIMNSILLGISTTLASGLKQNKLLPEEAKVIVKRAGEGYFGTAYSISFLDKDNNKIFRDKTIKHYKNLEKFNENDIYMFMQEKEIYKNIADKALGKFLKLILTPEEFKSLMKSRNAKNLEKRKKSSEELRSLFNNDDKIKLEYNGLLRESNVGNYIRSNVGHKLLKSNTVNMFYSDLNNRYSLLDYSSVENLGLITKKNIFELLGLSQRDISFNRKHCPNIIEGRLVDYGGFVIINKLLANNKVARRYFKKIYNARGKGTKKDIKRQIEIFNNLWAKAKNNKIPNSKDVKLGLDNARKLFPLNKRLKLSD